MLLAILVEKLLSWVGLGGLAWADLEAKLADFDVDALQKVIQLGNR